MKKYGDELGFGPDLLTKLEGMGRLEHWAAYSGGKDSGALTHWLWTQGKLKGVLSVNTTIGCDDTTQFIRKTCKEFGWDLVELTPPKGYDDFVRRFGFPKEGGHNLIMRWLKYKPLQIWARDNKANKPVIHSGVRSGESDRRFVNVTSLMQDSSLWMGAPIREWSTAAVFDYVDRFKIGISPVYNYLHISGDCLCGSFGDASEAMLIRMFYPDIANHIKSLEDEIRESPKIKPAYKKWGNNSSMTGTMEQKQLTEQLVCNDCRYRVPT